MERDGYLTCKTEREGRTSRKFYTITEKGARRTCGRADPIAGTQGRVRIGMIDRTGTTETRRAQGAPGEVSSAFLKLGLTSFGGPIAHLGYFRD
jgi:hypothetical protein